MYKEKIEELLRSTKRAGIEELINHMKENGFFTAPCSTRFHLAEEGGLAKHSFNVCENALKICIWIGIPDIIVQKFNRHRFASSRSWQDGAVRKSKLCTEYAERTGNKSKSGSSTEAE